MSKITLITPPDFYENSNPSILFIGFSEAQQEESSEWLGSNNLQQDLNLYYYQGEDTIEWLLYAVARADATYINADNPNPLIQYFLSYLVSKPTVFWSTDDEPLRQLLSYISAKQVNSISDFLKGVLSD